MFQKTLRKTLAVAAVALIGSFGAAAANAALVKTALSIVIDASGSINNTQYNQQRQAYANVFNNSNIVAADGSIVVNVVQFAASTKVDQTAFRLNDETDRVTLVNVFNNLNRSGIGGLTNIGGGINTGVVNMDAFLATLDAAEFDTDFRKLVDVSTDGFHNTGTAPGPVTANAVNVLGYSAVNCLGIGGGADCSWNNGFGFEVFAPSFDQLEEVLANKVRRETGQEIPEPATIALLGLGLVGIGVATRRRRVAA